MEQLLELILSGGLRLPLCDAEWLRLDRSLPKSDLFALLVLQRRTTVTMSELAADLSAPLSTATGIGARLERRGLIERERHPDDRRVTTLQLTQEGNKLAGQLRNQLNGVLDRIAVLLTPDELEQLLGLVRKVIGALHAPTPPTQVAQKGLRTNGGIRDENLDSSAERCRPGRCAKGRR